MAGNIKCNVSVCSTNISKQTNSLCEVCCTVYLLETAHTLIYNKLFVIEGLHENTLQFNAV